MIDLGLSVPPEELEKEWDSNVITPGTEFMTTLAHYLRFYVAHRVNTNKAWQNIKVLFSDGSEPGEGEHKIMDYIRKERAQVCYAPNKRERDTRPPPRRTMREPNSRPSTPSLPPDRSPGTTPTRGTSCTGWTRT